MTLAADPGCGIRASRSALERPASAHPAPGGFGVNRPQRLNCAQRADSSRVVAATVARSVSCGAQSLHTGNRADSRPALLIPRFTPPGPCRAKERRPPCSPASCFAPSRPIVRVTRTQLFPGRTHRLCRCRPGIRLQVPRRFHRRAHRSVFTAPLRTRRCRAA